MRILWNVLLGLTAAASAAVLLLQNFAFTALSPSLVLWLKILGTICCQWFFLRISNKALIRIIPLIVSGIAAVWGFFIFLTSPSWLHATFANFISDYAMYALICLGVLLLQWLIPRIIYSIRKKIRARRKKKKNATPPPQGYEKKKKNSKGANR